MVEIFRNNPEKMAHLRAKKRRSSPKSLISEGLAISTYAVSLQNWAFRQKTLKCNRLTKFSLSQYVTLSGSDDYREKNGCHEGGIAKKHCVTLSEAEE